MNADPAERTFLSLLGIAAAVVSALCAFTAAFFHGDARLDPLHADERLAGVALTALLAGVVITGVRRAVHEVRRRLDATAQLMTELRSLETLPPIEVLAAVNRHGLAHPPMWLETPEPVALTVGFAPARVVLSRGLFSGLRRAEFDAVVAHEAYHARRRDPLRALVGHGAAAALYYLPVVGRLVRRYEAHAELAADRQAIGDVGPAPVAGALSRLLPPPGTELAAATAMGGTTALEARLLQLETGAPPARVGPDGWVGSAVVFAVFVALLDGILLLLGLHTRLLTAAVDAVVHLAVFVGIWAGYVFLPAPLGRLTAARRGRISTT